MGAAHVRLRVRGSHARLDAARDNVVVQRFGLSIGPEVELAAQHIPADFELPNREAPATHPTVETDESTMDILPRRIVLEDCAQAVDSLAVEAAVLKRLGKTEKQDYVDFRK
jgi:hypothetical protein